MAPIEVVGNKPSWNAQEDKSDQKNNERTHPEGGNYPELRRSYWCREKENGKFERNDGRPDKYTRQGRWHDN
jgi:hypothetical protein